MNKKIRIFAVLIFLILILFPLKNVSAATYTTYWANVHNIAPSSKPCLSNGNCYITKSLQHSFTGIFNLHEVKDGNNVYLGYCLHAGRIVTNNVKVTYHEGFDDLRDSNNRKLSASRQKLLENILASGVQLSQSEFDALPSDVKREYFANYFKKLPLEQKIKLLSSIPNGAQKKTIYVMIARTDVNLFNAIVKDKDRADMLLSMGLPNDVNNKITNVVKFLAVSDVGYQNIAKKHDIEYDNDKKANNSSYTTNPYGFDAKEIYLKDKKGNLMV